jgi:hypothetical protein
MQPQQQVNDNVKIPKAPKSLPNLVSSRWSLICVKRCGREIDICNHEGLAMVAMAKANQ